MISAELIELATQFLKDRTKQTIYLDKEILAYRWSGGRHGSLLPIDVNLSLTLDDLHGIDGQKAQLIQNTRQFLQGLPANHVLMTGSRGAGKSSLIRGLLAKFYSQGDLYHLDKIRQVVKNTNNNCHYIVFCDDLAFNVEDENYRTLKSILDGALDSEQERLLVYATSNRRHLLPQMMKDNLNIYNGQTSEVNPYETIDETVSLSDRFGLWLSFHPMNQDTYLDIVRHYLGKNKLSLDDTAKHEALKWASLRGGRSGRIAYQFSRHWIGSQMLMD